MKLTISEAAAYCGYKSRTVLYRMLRDGLLRDYEAGRHGRNRLLESDPPGRCPLRDHIAANVQLRHDSPLGQRHGPLGELTDEALAAAMPTDADLAAAMAPIDRWIESQRQDPEWELIAARLNAFLGAWSAPPWTAEEVNTLAMAMALAQEGAGG